MIGNLLHQRYRFEAEIGRGGMGIIYRAHDLLLERDVAIKLLNQSGIGTAGRARLLHEAQAAARLNHPHIVSIYDAGEADGQSFIVMELVEGPSLYEQKKLPLSAVIDIATQICDALEHAHHHGIIHRDLKPENVLLAGSGQERLVKLTDFGLARSVTSRLSLEGPVSGTVFYLAPELALGQPFDGRADLYALGVMLYELLTGRLPFVADDPLAVISQHLHASVVPPSALDPEIPPALDQLVVQLLSKQPSDRPGSATEVRQALQALQNPLAPVPDQLPLLERLGLGRLVGRQRELSELDSIWQRVTGGEAHVLLISGEPGIGKTRLVRELMAHAAVAGGRVLQGECYAEGGLPYAPLGGAIQSTLGGASQAALSIVPYVLADLVTLAPDLRLQFPDLPPNPPLDPLAEQQRLFESVVAWCARLAAAAPVLLFIDDVHWADSGTLALLRHLARRARKLRLLMVLTYREVELDQAGHLQSVLHDLIRERLATRLKLTRLNYEHTRSLLASLLNLDDELDEHFVDAIFKETEGNPFFVEEVCKALVEQGKLCSTGQCWVPASISEIDIPQSIRLTIQSRLAHLPSSSQEVLRLAAILGREFDFELLQQASEADEESLVDALDIAEQSQIIAGVQRGRSMAFIFAHALIPSTIRESTSSLRRQRLHRRVAAAFEKLHPEDFEALAYHFEGGGDYEKAHEYYARAGDRALALYANQEAEKNYRASIESGGSDGDQARLLSGLGEALFRQSKYTEASQVWQQAIVTYQASGDHDNTARMVARAARAAWYGGDAELGLKLCLEGLNTISKESQLPGMAALLHETARAYRFHNQPAEALPLCQAALRMAETLGLVDVQAETLATLGIIPGQTPEAEWQYLSRAVELAESAGLLASAARAHLNLSDHLNRQGKISNARAHVLRAVDLARQIGNSSWEFHFLGTATDMSFLLGDLQAVTEALPVMKRLLPALPNPEATAAIIHMDEANLLFYRGEWEKAAELYLVCQAEKRQQAELGFLTEINLKLAEAFFEIGALEEVEASLREALEASADSPTRDRVRVRTLLSTLYSQRGETVEARRWIEEAQSLAGSPPGLVEEALLLWAVAHLAASEQCWIEAQASLEKAIEKIAGCGMRWYQARASLDLAEMYASSAGSGDWQRCRETFRRAAALFSQLQARRYLVHIEDRLQALEQV